ncbi:MAG TPA: DUF4012 domain-containing protein [Acidimicrobiales bacterium]|nr:DUF4012 domain-containing protein [Acidimicrobiales bacterium]
MAVRPSTRPRRRLGRRALFAVAGVLVLAAGGASAWAAVLARSHLGDARTHLEAGRAALLRPDAASAAASFRRADRSLAAAQSQLGAWWAAPGRLLPVVRQNVGVEAAVARAGRQVAAAGLVGASMAGGLPLDGGRLAPEWRDGAVALDPIEQVGRTIPRVRARLVTAERILASSPRSLLLPEVKGARSDALTTVADARRKADVAGAVAFLVPRMLGAGGARHWIVGAENSGELRGRGGYIGAMGVLEADTGRVHMGPFVATTDLPPLLGVSASTLPPEYRHYVDLGALNAWPNLTMSPDFSSAAAVLLDRLGASGGPMAEGVIATDPQALSYLLSATGPVSVDGLPEQITADNVVGWSLNRAYFEFPDDRTRKEILGRIASAVWSRALAGQDVAGRPLAAALGRALVEGHARLYSKDRAEEQAIVRAGVGGTIRSTPGDYLLVVGQNMGENKMDYYVRRAVSYRARVDSDGSVESVLRISVRNEASPTTAIPDYLGGPRPAISLPAASVRTYLSAFVPERAELQEFSEAGRPKDGFDNRPELGKRLFGTYLDVGPGEEREVSIRYRVPHAAGRHGYRLTVQNQSTVRPDDLTVAVDLPGRDDLRWKGPLVGDRSLAA